MIANLFIVAQIVIVIGLIAFAILMIIKIGEKINNWRKRK